jgi:hypothetical protein
LESADFEPGGSVPVSTFRAGLINASPDYPLSVVELEPAPHPLFGPGPAPFIYDPVSLPAVQATIALTGGGSGAIRKRYAFDFSPLDGTSGFFLLSGFADPLGGEGQRLPQQLSIVLTDGSVLTAAPVTGVDSRPGGGPPSSEFRIVGNYPNPFNPSTTLRFDLPERADVQVTVVDLLGRRVLFLEYGVLESGSGREVKLNASSLASGTYLYRLTASGARETYSGTGKMVLLR